MENNYCSRCIFTDRCKFKAFECVRGRIVNRCSSFYEHSKNANGLKLKPVFNKA
jgi:hypothetical protein